MQDSYVAWWLVLDITRSFDKESVRTMAALKAYAEANR
jgi:hypothetical protein